MNGSETAAPQAGIDASPIGAGARWAIMGISVWTTTGVGVVSAAPTGIGGHGNHRVCRAVLDWPRPGRSEHHSAAIGSRRTPAVRRTDNRVRLPRLRGHCADYSRNWRPRWCQWTYGLPVCGRSSSEHRDDSPVMMSEPEPNETRDH